MQLSPELRRRFAEANRVVVLTGAGVSAESGVPTFRGGGDTTVWKGMPFDVISSAEMIERDLPAVWEWFDYRRHFMASILPNAAHREIASWQERFAELTVVTQNIDGLHQKAGSQNVIELHGNMGLSSGSWAFWLRSTRILMSDGAWAASGATSAAKRPKARTRRSICKSPVFVAIDRFTAEPS
jgi:hypothetical protein